MSDPSPDAIRAEAEEKLKGITSGDWGVEDPGPDDTLSIVANPKAEAYDWVVVALVVEDPEEGIGKAQMERNATFTAAAPRLVRQLLALLDQKDNAAQLIADVLDEYKDDLTKQACDDCDDCGPMVMCRFHSVLSALQRHAWTNGAIERDNLKRRAEQAERHLARVTPYVQHNAGCQMWIGRGSVPRYLDSAQPCTCGLDTALTEQGEPKPTTPEHVCGLSGYNGMIDPPCPGCEAAARRRRGEA